MKARKSEPKGRTSSEMYHTKPPVALELLNRIKDFSMRLHWLVLDGFDGTWTDHNTY